MDEVRITEKRPTVLVVDDHPGMVEELCRILRPHFQVVGTASDGSAAFRAALELRPDFVLLDIEMPILDGIQVSREIRKSSIPSRIIFVTMHQDEDYVSHALDTGARGYVFKSNLCCDLPIALAEVTAGRIFVSSRVPAS